jgi:predicted nicotinamide N-methyase
MQDPAAFIRANTALIAPPLVPEIRLHLATEVVPLWRKTEEELEAEGVPPPFWAFAWAGGQALARYVLDNAEVVSGKSVLDFGAGSGLIGIAAKMAGAAQVLSADIDAFAGAAIALNAEANGQQIGVTTEDVLSPCFGAAAQHLSMTRAESARSRHPEVRPRAQAGGAPKDAPVPWQTILVGDMCYERPLAERLLAWLRSRVANGATVLIGDPGRSYFPKSGVEKRATYRVQTTRELEDQEIRETSVYRLLP